MGLDIKTLLKEMTLEEKIAVCSGADFWHTKKIDHLGIPPVMMCDGPHGLRKQEQEADHMGINESIKTVCYPSASALASSFDTEVLGQLGTVLGRECQAEDVGMLLGPGLNIKRSPLCGRNFEYFSEDPYLTGKLAAAYIKNLQKEGVAACVKHFAVNNQETMRMNGSSNVDERTLYEIYLPAFETAVKEGKTRGVMCAYNAVNGEFCSDSKELLTNILRKRWGYQGLVVTDWGAAKNAIKGVKAGLNLVMPGGYGVHEAALKEAVKNGRISEAEIDEIAEGILQFVRDCQEKKRTGIEIDRDKFAKISEDLAVQCAVLMKNEYIDGGKETILPLNKEAKTAFIGEFAEKPRYQGSGSSHINTDKVTSALDAAEDLDITYARGYQTDTEETDPVLLEEAVRIAEKAEVAVIFAGLPDSFESEGFDREGYGLPENQNVLIEEVAKVQRNIVVVFHGGSPVELPWLERVKGMLCMYLGGQQAGAAAVRLLFGKDNPCGKLAETWPLKLSDNPSYLNFPGVDGNVDYCERIYVGYRYYDKKEMKVQFPFGHGLSYTEFCYSDMHISQTDVDENDTVTVSCKIKNTGNTYGKEAVQLYVRDKESSIDRPVRELKGFVKLGLNPGEEKEAVFVLDKRSFAYYEVKIHDWFVESGQFIVEIGASSRDIRLSTEIHVESMDELPVYYTPDTPVGSLKKTAKGREVLKQFLAEPDAGKEMGESTSDALGKAAEKMQQKMFLELPLGALTSFGEMTKEQLDKMLVYLNDNK